MRRTFDEVVRAAAPKARIRWAGAPAGSLPIDRDTILGALLLSAMLAADALVQVFVVFRHETFGPCRPFSVIAVPFWIAWVVVDMWRHARERRRTRYVITTVGIFVGDGTRVVRFALPERTPIDRGDALDLGVLEADRIALDGRGFGRRREPLLLRGLSARKRDVLRVLSDLRPGAGSVAPARPATPLWSHVLGGALVVLGLALGAVLGPPVFGVLGLMVFALFGFVATVGVAGVAWRATVGRCLRRRWARSRTPMDTATFAERTGASPLVVDELREWLASLHGVAPELFWPVDPLRSLEPLRSPPPFGRPISIEPLLVASWSKATTVGDLARQVERELSEGSRLSFSERIEPLRDAKVA